MRGERLLLYHPLRVPLPPKFTLCWIPDVKPAISRFYGDHRVNELEISSCSASKRGPFLPRRLHTLYQQQQQRDAAS